MRTCIKNLFSSLLVFLFAVFGTVSAWSLPSNGHLLQYQFAAQKTAFQSIDLPFAARAPPLTGENVTFTGTQLTGMGDARVYDGAGVRWASLNLDADLDATNKGYIGPKVDPTPPTQSTFAPGSAGAAKVWTKTARLKDAQLPNQGRIRFVPPKNWDGTTPLKRGPNNGFVDKFGNEWTRGSSRTQGQAFEWDVQLSPTGRSQIGWTTRDGSHANVSLDGKITHK